MSLVSSEFSISASQHFNIQLIGLAEAYFLANTIR
jgi:hypothetical protein